MGSKIYFIIIFLKISIILSMKNEKSTEKNYAEIQMSSIEALKIYQRWIEGAFSGVIAAFANQRYIFKVNIPFLGALLTPIYPTFIE